MGLAGRVLHSFGFDGVLPINGWLADEALVACSEGDRDLVRTGRVSSIFNILLNYIT